jgi:hypothetical protein
MLMSLLIERLLQKALNMRDYEAINRIMPKIFPDFDSEYIRALISYNEEEDINAYDLVRLKGNFPNMKFASLFHYEVGLVRGLCNISEEDLEILNPPCG